MSTARRRPADNSPQPVPTAADSDEEPALTLAARCEDGLDRASGDTFVELELDSSMNISGSQPERLSIQYLNYGVADRAEWPPAVRRRTVQIMSPPVDLMTLRTCETLEKALELVV